MSETLTPSAHRREILAGRLALASAALFWSGNFVAGRALRDAIDPFWLNLLRWSITLVLLLPFSGRALWQSRSVVLREWRLILGLGLTGVAAFQILVYQALRLTSVANAVLLLATMPMVIIAGSALLGKTRIGVIDVLTLALSISGVAVLLSDGDLGALWSLRIGLGDLWMLLAVLAWSAYTLLLRRAPADLRSDVSFSASVIVMYPAMALLALATGLPDLAPLTSAEWARIAYIGIFPGLVAFLAWSYGVQKVGPEAAGFFINLMPVFAMTLAYVLLGEGVSSTQLFGAVVILGAVALSQRRPQT